ncbi:MAG: AzlC family ABC transporter permease [Actinobacteria bacterium]|nr:AzlC family ABC transporter permease [Actinomycetota bacterium]MCG2808361.1 AzlC family ABC transporter permease [Coriobacteriia bacterium]
MLRFRAMPNTLPIGNAERGARFVRGLKLGLPVFLGYMPVGAAFGILATGLGFSTLQACACSATALAGAGQFIALSVIRAGEGIFAVLAATTVVNLRYVLFGATISPYLRGLTLPRQALLAYFLTDETFAININDRRVGLSTGWSMFGVGVISWVGWVSGTLVGAAAASWIGDPSRWGVEFAMPAMFVALLIALAENRQHVIAACMATAIALALPAAALIGMHIPSAWFIVMASVGAATVATLLFPDRSVA